MSQQRSPDSDSAHYFVGNVQRGKSSNQRTNTCDAGVLCPRLHIGDSQRNVYGHKRYRNNRYHGHHSVPFLIVHLTPPRGLLLPNLLGAPLVSLGGSLVQKFFDTSCYQSARNYQEGNYSNDSTDPNGTGLFR